MKKYLIIDVENDKIISKRLVHSEYIKDCEAGIPYEAIIEHRIDTELKSYINYGLYTINFDITVSIEDDNNVKLCCHSIKNIKITKLSNLIQGE